MQQNRPPRLITVHLPEGDTGIKVRSRSDAERLANSLRENSVNPKSARHSDKREKVQLVAVFADEDHNLRAFATGRSELVEAMAEDAHPFVCLTELLEAATVWVFAPCDAAAAIRRSVRTFFQDSDEFNYDISCTCGSITKAADKSSTTAVQ